MKRGGREVVFRQEVGEDGVRNEWPKSV